MAVNTSAQYQADVRRQLSKETLPITVRYLVLRQFAPKKKMEKGAGVTWTATRFNRLPLAAAPLSEGVPPVGQQLSISQVTGVALQWGDKITLSDVAVTTTLHDLIQQSKQRLGEQIANMRERNGFQNLMGGTQVNYVNQRGSRALLQAGDVLDTVTVRRTATDLSALGAPYYNGQTSPNVERSINHGVEQANKTATRSAEHYVSITSDFAMQDLSQNATVVNAWSYSDHTKLYINEVGYWAGITFVKSNMLPRWTGVAAIQGAPGTSGALATNANYYVQVTGVDALNQWGESLVYQVSNAISVTGPNGSISVTVPSTAGYTYNIYVNAGSSSVSNLAASNTAGVGIPTTGPLTGMATGIAPGSTVVISGVGQFQVPPAAPATGVTVYPTFVFGSDAFACTELEDVDWNFLTSADKSDPLNQLRVIGWKYFEGWVITNNAFMARIESSVSNTGAFG